MSYNESLSKSSNYPLMSQSEWVDAPWNQPLSELYDWACGDYEQDPLDEYDE